MADSRYPPVPWRDVEPVVRKTCDECGAEILVGVLSADRNVSRTCGECMRLRLLATRTPCPIR